MFDRRVLLAFRSFFARARGLCCYLWIYPRVRGSFPRDTSLISGFAEWSLFFLACILVLVFSLYYKFSQFSALSHRFESEVTVLSQYIKHGKNVGRTVFKTRDGRGNVFYYSRAGKFDDLRNSRVLLKGKLYDCSFLKFLKGCYVVPYKVSPVLGDFSFNLRSAVVGYIHGSHPESKLAANLFSTLFMATSLDPKLRDFSNSLGLSHILSISGFHMAILCFICYFTVAPIYRVLQYMYFPYRNAGYDIGVVVLVFTFFYLYLIEYQPSFFRAFLMGVVSYVVFVSGTKLLNFSLLGATALLAICINPSLVFNIGFFLSVSGVFYIFLFFKYVRLDSKAFYVLAFNVSVFVSMMPIVHYFFPSFTPLQLVSVVVSILFIFLFIFFFIAHLFGFAYVLDHVVDSCVSNSFYTIGVYTPDWLMAIYVLLSLLSVRYRVAYLFVALISLGFFAYSSYLFSIQYRTERS